MRLSLLIPLLAATVLPGSSAAKGDKEPSPYEVVWDSPSRDHHGTMPLGNGEVAVNAWVDAAGDLRVYLARTDSWDESGRLLKVGLVRIRVGDGDAGRTKTFRQALTVKDGTMSVRYGSGGGEVGLRLWVDAHRPVVCAEATTARPTEATAFLEPWRTAREELPSVETSDIFAGRREKTVVEPDVVLTGLADRVGWYHRNVRSVGPELCARIQGVADFPRPDPLLHRTSGGLVAASRAVRVDDKTLRSGAGTRHLFEVCVHTRHPATAAEWLAEAGGLLDAARAVPVEDRRAAHEKWWADFWGRSWIHITPNGQPARATKNAGPPANRHPLRVGLDQAGGSRFPGEIGRVGVYAEVLPEADLRRLAGTGPKDRPPGESRPIFTTLGPGPVAREDFAGLRLPRGLTLEAWVKLPARPGAEGRIVDKITAGGSDGFLLDVRPGGAVRLISGRETLQTGNVLKPGVWQHLAGTVTASGHLTVFVDGRAATAGESGEVAGVSDAFVVSRAYALQRFVAACAGRGRYPIKFNGSLFTVPHAGGPGDADYRRWGPGYWWQNTRLPYYAMPAAGDADLMRPLFRMYAQDLLPLFVYRTHKHTGHAGAYIPECIYFWGDLFTETYGWQPCDERTDKLQASGWHKREWVSGLELAGLLLDYYEHTGDREFLKGTALPLAREVLTFFDRHYKTGPDGKLVMHPAQALETWWDCVNPMPELAGLHAVTARLLALPEAQTTAEERAFWVALRAKLPPVPTRTGPMGETMLAAAQEFKDKRNIENPELYAVFPFRLFALDKPHKEWAVAALEHRTDRGAMGWRQDDIFMATLGLADEAREYVVRRARSKHAASRFPVFWGPNYDWVPDQDHGSVLLKAVQTMLLQTEGKKIILVPAWPADWDAEFKLHAPFGTTLTGRVEKGKVTRLDVQPPERKADVVVWGEGK